MKAYSDKNHDLANRLRVFRLNIGLSQKKAAAEFGIRFSTYKRYESGTNEPSSEAISGMVRMGLNSNWLLTGEGEMLQATTEPQRLNQPIGLASGEQANVLAMARVSADAEPSSGLALDEEILAACHAACKRVYGDAFDELSASEQIGYAADFYNLLVKMPFHNSRGLDQMKRLESDGMVKLLNVSILLGWVQEFPPSQQWSF